VPGLDAITVKDARLGRLVLKPLEPHQDFLDLPGTPEASMSEAEDVQTFHNRITSTSFRSRFSNFLSVRASNKNEGAQEVSAQKVITYKLNNSGKWFRQSCGLDDVRDWVRSARYQGDQIYLITGYCVLNNTHYAAQRGANANASGHVHVPIPPALDGGITFNFSASVAHGRKVEERIIASFPGQMVCAMQYRKLKFKWHSRQELDSGLLTDNMWKLTSAFRSKNACDEEVVLEVDLAGDSDKEEDDSDEEDDDSDE